MAEVAKTYNVIELALAAEIIITVALGYF